MTDFRHFPTNLPEHHIRTYSKRVYPGNKSKTESKTTLLPSFLLDNNRHIYHPIRLQKPIGTLEEPIQKAYKGSSSPPFGITRLLMSVVVDSTLVFPPQRLLVSLKIVCCLAVFLSTFLSAYTA